MTPASRLLRSLRKDRIVGFLSELRSGLMEGLASEPTDDLYRGLHNALADVVLDSNTKGCAG